MSKYQQSHADLFDHLQDQIRFIEASGESYDLGSHGEALRLATVIRVLVHETKNSISLLGQLGKKDMLFHDMSNDIDPHPNLSQAGLVLIQVVGGKVMSYEPPLESVRPRAPIKVSFRRWWDKVVVRDLTGATFTRRRLVLDVSNKEGGAHVDPKLDADYAKLSRFNSMGWKVSVAGGPQYDPINSPVLPSIRQIAHEVLRTLKDEYPDLVGPLPSGPFAERWDS